ncbi:hypothetical protein AAG747_02175 [Rapidithrix thailandica]|uniref:Glycosyltransferase RgtA/B/C/D-like domain-containing protein n=1 Tax=Rapidithrix thailandica TaxID=413964 RepID=A0AAW9S7G7_9BACT
MEIFQLKYRKQWIKMSLGAYFFIYLFVHLYTLDLHSMPWFDETYMSSLTKEFSETGEFRRSIAADNLEKPTEPTYGPVFFVLTTLSTRLLGFEIFSYRLVVFFSGLLLVAVLTLFYRLFHTSLYASLGLAFVLAHDPFFSLAMHEGRNDLTAAFFMLCALYFFFKGYKKAVILQKGPVAFLRPAIFSGIWVAIALLTSPRAGFILPFIALFFLSLGRRYWTCFAIWSGIIGALYSIWVFYAYGGYPRFFQHFLALSTEFTKLNENRVLYIPKHQWLLIPVALVALCYQLIIYRLQAFRNIVFSVGLAGLCLFYVLVFDLGPYSSYAIPYYYLLIFSALIPMARFIPASREI